MYIDFALVWGRVGLIQRSHVNDAKLRPLQVPSQCRQRLEDRHTAGDPAELRFHAPNGQNEPARDAVLGFDPREQWRMLALARARPRSTIVGDTRIR